METRHSSIVEELLWDHLVDCEVRTDDDRYSEELSDINLSLSDFSGSVCPEGYFSEYQNLKKELTRAKTKELKEAMGKL